MPVIKYYCDDLFALLHPLIVFLDVLFVPPGCCHRKSRWIGGGRHGIFFQGRREEAITIGRVKIFSQGGLSQREKGHSTPLVYSRRMFQDIVFYSMKGALHQCVKEWDSTGNVVYAEDNIPPILQRFTIKLRRYVLKLFIHKLHLKIFWEAWMDSFFFV